MCVCIYGHTYSKSTDRPGKVAISARGQPKREIRISRSPFAPDIWPREKGSAVPSRVQLADFPHSG